MKFSLSIFVIGVLVLVGLIFPASPGYADIYKWVDENGTVWLTDDPENLPEESQGKFEKVMATEKAPESSPQKKAPRSLDLESGGRAVSATEEYLENRGQKLNERNKLVREISTLEANLSAARRALTMVPLTDRRGYWFVIDSAGNKVPASYKAPGAIWKTQTWPTVPRSARTKESEERKRIQSDIVKFERDLERVTEKLSKLSRSL